MAYSKKLIHFATRANFDVLLAANNILDTSICFIKDAKQIWTHGQFYSCPFTEEEIEQLFVGSKIKLDGYVETASPINISETDTVNEAFGKIEEYLGTLDELNAILVDTGDAAEDPIINDYISSSELNLALILKLDVISDLDIIRQGASKGATAVLPADISDMETKTNAASTYATKTTVNSKQDKVTTVDHGTSDTSFALTPNIFHVWGTVTTLTLTLATPSDSTIYNTYMFLFTSGTTATTLSLPSTISWQNDINIKANKTYQISILNNCGVIGGF